jgi:hypothetical protein
MDVDHDAAAGREHVGRLGLGDVDERERGLGPAEVGDLERLHLGAGP